MTREEFGVDIFEAIKCIGGLLAIQDQVNAAVYLDQTLDPLVAKREALKVKLIGHMKQLSDTDTAEILQRYPIVGMM
ncbi:MAG: hypothetical protein ACYCZR_01100 [Burkholderiales bacterium]